MAILVLEHHEVEQSSRLGEFLQEYSNRLHVVKLHQGMELPTDLDDIEGLLLMGGPQNLDEVEEYPYLECEMALVKRMHEMDLPIVGVCLGAQIITKALGGEVGKMEKAEIGFKRMSLNDVGRMEAMLYGLPWDTMQFHTHAYEVTKLPPGGQLLGSSSLCKNQLFCVGMKTWGAQFHFEWTKKDLEKVLRQFSGWLREEGIDEGDLREEIVEHYQLYRHLGDRICERLAILLFPVDKRVDHTRWPVENYNACDY